MKIRYTFLFLLILLLSAFQKPTDANFKKMADKVLVRPAKTQEGEPYSVRIRVISDNIIQVLALPDSTPGATNSLMVVGADKPLPAWKLKKNGETLRVLTKELQVEIAASTGDVIFRDKYGRELVKEASGSHPGFSPVTYGSEQTYQVQQAFQVADDEAFYGLGQHQAGLMNYRGWQVDLTQYNSVAAVPFLVSSKNYGILWDNNSITRFGDVRPYRQLSDFALYDKYGNPGALTATYVSAEKAGKAPVVRPEKQLNYEFLEQQKDFPEGYALQGGNVTWEGFIQSGETGTHRFLMPASGYVKVWLDGQLLLDRWREAWNPGFSNFKYELQQGKKHALKIEWQPDGGQSYIALRYLPPQSAAAASTVSFASEAGDERNYYFVYGNNLDEVIRGYRELTGKAQVMPKWAMGFWQSRERYKTQDELLSVAQEFRRRQIPIDNIVLDWSYWEEDQWGSQQFDKSRFPDPEGMVKQVHDLDMQLMISVWPKFYEGIDNYKLFDAKGLLYKKSIDEGIRDWIGKGYVSTFYDAFNPEGRQLFWDLLKINLQTKGIDAWWLDATEPDILSNTTIEHRKQLMNPTYLGPAEKYFNAYPLMNAKAIYEGQRRDFPDKRVFILTRSAFGGLQRYGAAIWSGDIAATFEELGRQIPAGLNASLSGIPYWTTDIGGFFVEDKYDRPAPKGEALEEWRELNTRWYQYGAFTPLYRSHGQKPFREVFNIAPEDHKAYQSIVYYNRLRYRLMPYIYSLTGQVYHQDGTIMRPLVMDFGQDKIVRNISDQFMFGPALLINPVYEANATTRSLYLPAGTGWYNLYDGRYTPGGQQLTAAAPYETMPIYVKAGAIIPYGPELQYTGEKPADIITLYVYSGQDGRFELYEDENTNYNYEKGKFATIPFTYNDAKKQLTIGRREGSFEGMLQNRTFNIIYVDSNKPRKLDFEAKPDKVVQYSGKAKTVKLR
ncbi:glycoside hydrolase family 31 protein [Botryobacter ruber]|uniref:glycoside hydrolase family 31 protein n=1 Tax=Botryobacter ruber TaxID=2171629 RepID=UPI000E0C7951|nr:TIM-barrel domain-containing protein [Botryobacter ruber]